MASIVESAKIPIDKLKDMVTRATTFKKEIGRDPKFVYVDPPASANKNLGSSPSGWMSLPSYKPDLQDTEYTCALSSLQMAFSELNVDIKEMELFKPAGTTTKGTGHSGLWSAIKYIVKKTGKQFAGYDRNFKDVGWNTIASLIVDPNQSLILHVRTGPLKPYWLGDYGHYVFPIAINLITGRIRIADPKKGVTEYPLSVVQEAIRQCPYPSVIVIKKV